MGVSFAPGSINRSHLIWLIRLLEEIDPGYEARIIDHIYPSCSFFPAISGIWSPKYSHLQMALVIYKANLRYNLYYALKFFKILFANVSGARVSLSA